MLILIPQIPAPPKFPVPPKHSQRDGEHSDGEPGEKGPVAGNGCPGFLVRGEGALA